ncbi:MAG: sigma-54-dependent Fis family transcriptional regulator [Desulfovibrionaceae bacterium]|jgi:two-component system NtrC family response regulator|nr:sigma-54-dependent Fis family transcriptional regulator [Desulfovibrionaceae bacterium]
MKFLIIDDDVEICETMQSLARRMGLDCAAAYTLAQGMAELQAGDVEVVFLDVRLPDGNGLEALPRIKNAPGAPEVIILTGQGDPDGAELAIQGGVWDYLVKPSPIKQTMLSLKRALAYRREKRQERSPDDLDLADVVGKSPRMQACFDLVALAAQTNSNVLVSGETGTGKELFARAIHANSARSGGSFVVVDCASLTETLVESTLFGHRKGAYTSADRDREGLIKLADKGTLFLDEVGELPMSIQRAFLRVLQEKRFRPVGSTAEITSDFRLVAATHRNLEALVEEGTFRRDLLFRLKTINIELPSLREREEDIGLLAEYKIDMLCREYDLAGKEFDADFLPVLQRYDWPGNVRELFNVLERAFVASGRDRTLFAMHLPRDIRIHAARFSLQHGGTSARSFGAGAESSAPGAPRAAAEAPAENGAADAPATASASPAPRTRLDTSGSLKEFKARMEQAYLNDLMARHGHDVQRMLEISGLSRSHFYALVKKYDLAT